MNFYTILINWYSIYKRSLPWRETKDPYFIWLSEIILQQTQVKQGLPYYKTFVKAYPKIQDLANDLEQNVLKNWQGLGYYSRARNLHYTAKTIAYDHHGIFPNNYKELIKLKGVGDYTASAIASIAFNEAKAVLDGNVFRVLARYFGVDTPINSTEGLKEFKALAQSLIFYDDPGTYNQAIMEFGALQCKPKNPDCKTCPLNNSCLALKHNTVDKLPVKLKKTKIQKKYFNYLVFIDPLKNTLIEQRSTKGIWQNLYQFPLIESSNSITEKQFNSLLMHHDYDSSSIGNFYTFNSEDIVHKLSHRHLYVKFWIIELHSNLPNGVASKTLSSYPVPVLIANFLKEFNFETA